MWARVKRKAEEMLLERPLETSDISGLGRDG
jgi:hypothetical protein